MAQTGSGGAPPEHTDRVASLARQIEALSAAHAAGGAAGDCRPRPSHRGVPGADPIAARSGRLSGSPMDEGGHEDPEAAARAICLRLLTGAARTRAALAEALRRRGIPDDAATRVLDRLTEVGLIDDAAYAVAYVAAKHRDRALGQAALRTELRRKGIAEAAVADAVSVIDTEAERARARSLVARRVDSAMTGGPVAARRRLLALLSRRGYPSDIAVSVVDQELRQYEADSAEIDGGGDGMQPDW